MMDASNLSWMKSPSGAALRFQEFHDRIAIIIDGRSSSITARSGVALDAMIFIQDFAPQGLENVPLLSLGKGSKAVIELYQDRWADTPVVRAEGRGTARAGGPCPGAERGSPLQWKSAQGG